MEIERSTAATPVLEIKVMFGRITFAQLSLIMGNYHQDLPSETSVLKLLGDNLIIMVV